MPHQITSRLSGFVLFVADKQGFGIIRTDDHVEYFFNARDVEDTTALFLPLLDEKRVSLVPLKGKVVLFQPVTNTAKGKRPRATRVEVAA